MEQNKLGTFDSSVVRTMHIFFFWALGILCHTDQITQTVWDNAILVCHIILKTLANLLNIAKISGELTSIFGCEAISFLEKSLVHCLSLGFCRSISYTSICGKAAVYNFHCCKTSKTGGPLNASFLRTPDCTNF